MEFSRRMWSNMGKFGLTQVRQNVNLKSWAKVAERGPSHFVVIVLFRATPATYASSQARGPIGAVAVGLHHSHSNARSEPRLRPLLMATPDP